MLILDIKSDFAFENLSNFVLTETYKTIILHGILTIISKFVGSKCRKATSNVFTRSEFLNQCVTSL